MEHTGPRKESLPDATAVDRLGPWRGNVEGEHGGLGLPEPSRLAGI